jgi:hypothetical protein
MRRRGMQTKCRATKPVGMLERSAFWKRGRTAIFDIQVCDTDTKSYGNRKSMKVLEGPAHRKKDKYEEARLKRR